MSVADWMQACLADPDHGYYMNRDPLGRSGDFITSPEISQMFGELLGLWAAVAWQQMGQPEQVNLVELGPGRGTLMADALRAARGVPDFLAAADVHMVETSPVLRGAQQSALKDAPVACSWHSSLDEVPSAPAIMLGNEFLDALPIRQFVRVDGAWCEREVGLDDGAFVFCAGAPVADAPVPAAFESAPDGSIFEVAPPVRAVTEAIGARLAAEGGAALLIDYGHDEPGLGETLQAVKGHTYADPLGDPGECDLTAHVDFALVAATARTAGARVWGPIGQGDLLERLGIAARAAQLLAGADKRQAALIGSARQRLTRDDAMGRLFRALALTHPGYPAPPGFETISWA
ncbi:MAG: SAM-dependent methyltransferase [Rhodospirillales bacterium]|nr:SAM-dependent methyltransferase [Rhodospirillales bacterium]MBO6785424.1 SAM-dependent methyltransferase [Rhodospirillales bacterium]